MAKGAEGKVNVTAKIAEAFGVDYIGEVDKKLYVWTTENGERIQIAITLTCPKVMIETENGTTNATGGDYNFEDISNVVSPKVTPAVEITEAEKQNIANLMAKLGL